MHWPIERDQLLGMALSELAMGLDALYRTSRNASGESALAAEGLVPVDLWRGQPLSLADWSAAGEAVAALQSHTSLLTDPVRRAFVEDTLLSLATFVAWQSGHPPAFR